MICTSYRVARRAVRDLGLVFDEALIGIDMVVALGPDDPDAQEAAAESRRILEGLGAVPYLARLDALVAGASVPGAAVADPAYGPQGPSGTPNQNASSRQARGTSSTSRSCTAVHDPAG